MTWCCVCVNAQGMHTRYVLCLHSPSCLFPALCVADWLLHTCNFAKTATSTCTKSALHPQTLCKFCPVPANLLKPAICQRPICLRTHYSQGLRTLSSMCCPLSRAPTHRQVGHLPILPPSSDTVLLSQQVRHHPCPCANTKEDCRNYTSCDSRIWLSSSPDCALFYNEQAYALTSPNLTSLAHYQS